MKNKRQDQPLSNSSHEQKNGNPSRMAFALGGLAGNNAHGAGFLAGALDSSKIPVMISCTSGQILWVSKYLECLRKKDHSGDMLKTMFENEVNKVKWCPDDDFNLGSLMFLGRPHMYKPLHLGYLGEYCHNIGNSMRHILGDFEKGRAPFLTRSLCDVPPARLLRPDFEDKFYDEIATTFQNSHIGIAFNSYNPAEGVEYVYLNHRARKLLKQEIADDEQRYEPGQKSSLTERRVYEDISSRAVRHGLWLYWYGFGDDYQDHLDGAYFRQIMLAELTFAHTIYVARPLHFHWSGELPNSMAELEDLKTKLSFNGAYVGERHQIQLVNNLIAEDKPAAKLLKQKYHPINVEEIEMDQPRGFFGYAFEDMDVFDNARVAAARKLGASRAHKPIPQEAPV